MDYVRQRNKIYAGSYRVELTPDNWTIFKRTKAQLNTYEPLPGEHYPSSALALERVEELARGENK